MEVDIQVHGAAEVTRRLYQFSNRLGDRVILLAVRNGANFLLKKVREAEPKKSGRLRRATRVAKSKIHTSRRDGQIGVYLTISKGKKRDDPRGAWYGRFVEHGYKRGTTQVPGRHFIANTFDRNKETTARLIIADIEQAGIQLAREIGL
jgi:HK97 gp10 family phage protein